MQRSGVTIGTIAGARPKRKHSSSTQRNHRSGLSAPNSQADLNGRSAMPPCPAGSISCARRSANTRLRLCTPLMRLLE
jgi:hypothetical protein